MIRKTSVTNVMTILIVLLMLAAGCTGVPASVPIPSPAATTQAGSSATVASSSNCSPVTITQTDGKQVILPCKPQRIIVANSNAAEMVIALGAGDKIVGVTQSTTNVSYIMEKIPQAENIGDWQIPNVEEILALHPDIVIAYASSKPKNIDQLEAANITIVYIDCFRLSTLASDARAIGALTGTSEKAEIYARMVEETVADVSGTVRNIPDGQYPTVYSESYSDYTVSGPGSGADEMLTLAGGRNIAANITTASAKITTEWIIAQRPDFIFKVISSNNIRPFPEIHADLMARQGWETIPAVKNNRVYIFANDIQYGPRSYIGLVYTAQILHPDVSWEVHPGTMLDEYASRYVSGTNKTGMVYP